MRVRVRKRQRTHVWCSVVCKSTKVSEGSGAEASRLPRDVDDAVDTAADVAAGPFSASLASAGADSFRFWRELPLVGVSEPDGISWSSSSLLTSSSMMSSLITRRTHAWRVC